MAFEVFHFPYNRADHPSSWDLAFSIHEDMDVIQALCLNHLVSDLRFQGQKQLSGQKDGKHFPKRSQLV